jgi:hypothetical protein
MDKMSLGGVSPAAFEQASSLEQNLSSGLGSVQQRLGSILIIYGDSVTPVNGLVNSQVMLPHFWVSLNSWLHKINMVRTNAR